nr:polyprenol reductase 2-like isoform X2 [Ipomoea batatas]
MLLLMETQALRRLFESIYVFKYSPSARMHILGYFAGLFFYTAAPLSLCCNFALEVLKFIVSLVQELIVEGNDRMQVTEFDWWGFVNPLMQLRWYAWVGVAIFFWGWIHQHCCHAILPQKRIDGICVNLTTTQKSLCHFALPVLMIMLSAVAVVPGFNLLL